MSERSHNHSKSGVFLIELLIIIAVFAICSAVCVKVLATAEEELDYSERLTLAANYACDIAERFRSGEEKAEIIEEYSELYSKDIEILPNAKDFSGGTLVCTLEQTEGENNVSYLKIVISDGGEHTYADVTAARTD